MARRPGIGRDLEGVHAVAAAVAAGRVVRLTVDRARHNQPAISSIVEAARASGAEIQIVSSVAADAVTDAHQGIVAKARPIATASVDELARADDAALVVLDHIEDPHNLGAIARSAAAAGMTGLVASDTRAAPFSATAFKSSVGALERLPVAIVGSVAAALERLAKHQVWSIGLAATAGQSLFGLSLLDQPCAIVVGAEGGGLSQLVSDRCDVLASIPMESGESLNASVAAAMASYEVMRIRGNRLGTRDSGLQPDS